MCKIIQKKKTCHLYAPIRKEKSKKGSAPANPANCPVQAAYYFIESISSLYLPKSRGQAVVYRLAFRFGICLIRQKKLINYKNKNMANAAATTKILAAAEAIMTGSFFLPFCAAAAGCVSAGRTASFATDSTCLRLSLCPK